MATNTYMQLDSFTRQYIATALWSSHDDAGRPLDSNYDPEDIAEESLKAMAEDCKRFREQAGDLYCEENLHRPPDKDWEGTFGHDFWLTRNGHGAGFWDGDYEPYGGQLTEIACSFRECDLYVGDDGKLYVQRG